MNIFRGSWSTFSETLPSVVSVGSFDGVHLGHRHVLQRVAESAKEFGKRSVVLTFDTHPRNVVGDVAHQIPLLTTLDEKLELIESCGIDMAMVVHFDHTVLNMTPAEFVRVVLIGRIGMKKVIIGYNHGFGKGRSGDRESLLALSRSLEFNVEVINPVRLDETIVSSSWIRSLIAEGKMLEASKGLGRFYGMRGTVIRGFGRGRRLGCPTANLGLIPSGKMSPCDGIYSGLATFDNETWPAAISIGYNPTFAENKHSVEAHLIDFDGDLYDKELKVQFVERIRGETKFTTEADLAEQIQQDIRLISRKLSERGLFNHAVQKNSFS